MPPNKRDPRVDPKAGDELRVFYGGRIQWWRRVVSSDRGVWYRTSKGRNSKWIPIWRWQEQMKNAEVIHAAD